MTFSSEAKSGASPEHSSRGWHVISLETLKRPPETLAGFAYALLFLVTLGFLMAFFWSLVETFMALQEEKQKRAEDVRFFFTLLAGVTAGPILIWGALVRQSNLNLTRRTHVAEVFQKASDSLGEHEENTLETSDDPSTNAKATKKTTSRSMQARIAAIYALERVGKISVEDHNAAHHLLAALVVSKKIGADRDLALKVIGRRFETPRKASDGFERIDLAEVDFTRMSNGPHRFQRSDFTKAKFGLKGARAFQAEDCTFDHALFKDLNLPSTPDALQFYGCDFESTAFFNATMPLASFSNGTRLISVQFLVSNLGSARFENCVFENTKFISSDLSNATFVGCRFRNLELERCWMPNVQFTDCIFEEREIKAEGSIVTQEARLPKTVTLTEVLTIDNQDAPIEQQKWQTLRNFDSNEMRPNYESYANAAGAS